MAKIGWVEDCLLSWAEVVTTGRDGTGFPDMNVLHKDWMPPTPGSTPTMRTGSGRDAKVTHAAIALLSLRVRNTVVVHYCLRLSVAEQGERLGCSKAVLYARLDKAHRLLSKTLGF